MRWKDITEAPIADFSTHGDMEQPGTFRGDDLKKINNPEWRTKVRSVFARCPYDINLVLINGDEQGRVKRSGKTWIDRIYPLDNTKSLSGSQSYIGLQSLDWARSILGDELPPSVETSVTVMLFANEATDRVGLTPWMVAHRIGHAFFETGNRREVMEPFKEIYRKCAIELGGLISRMIAILKWDFVGSEAAIRDAAKLISPFRSAQAGTMRDSGEYTIELFAQFLTAGRVSFVPHDNPEIQRMLDAVAKTLTAQFDTCMKRVVGKVVAL